jgi:hypothetical protein
MRNLTFFVAYKPLNDENNQTVNDDKLGVHRNYESRYKGLKIT